MDTEKTSDESKSDEPQTTKIESLGNFSLEEKSLDLSKSYPDHDVVAGMTRQELIHISLGDRYSDPRTPEQEAHNKPIELARVAINLWEARDSIRETSHMQAAASNKIQTRFRDLEELAYWADGLGPCPKDTDGDGNCGRPSCFHCQTKKRARDLK